MADRDKNGRLVPGHKDFYTPEKRAEDQRRKKKQRADLARKYKEAISQTLGPEEVPQLLREMLEFARFYKSVRGMEALLRFVVDYGIGTPQKENFLEPSESSAEDWANAFADNETGQEDQREWPGESKLNLADLLQRQRGEQALEEGDRPGSLNL